MLDAINTGDTVWNTQSKTTEVVTRTTKNYVHTPSGKYLRGSGFRTRTPDNARVEPYRQQDVRDQLLHLALDAREASNALERTTGELVVSAVLALKGVGVTLNTYRNPTPEEMPPERREQLRGVIADVQTLVTDVKALIERFKVQHGGNE